MGVITRTTYSMFSLVSHIRCPLLRDAVRSASGIAKLCYRFVPNINFVSRDPTLYARPPKQRNSQVSLQACSL